MSKATIYQGDCLAIMRQMAEDGVKVQSIVTDPPYGLVSTVKRFGKEGSAPALSKGATGVYARASRGFMGQLWDGTGIEQRPETWRLCWDLLPPGGYLLAFGGTRTWHRIAVAIEDAGFEIRDSIFWLFGSGFPKSHDVSKGIDKMLGAERTERVGPKPGHEHFVGRDNMKALRESGALSSEGGFSRPWMFDAEKVEAAHWSYAPATDVAREWQGWGTALKPAAEPIIVARKPLEGTVAANVLAHGVGAINIDACRIGDFVNTTPSGMDRLNAANAEQGYRPGTYQQGPVEPSGKMGRWPANVLHDGSDEVEAAFAAYGSRGAAAPVGGDEPSEASVGRVTGRRARVPGVFHADSGSASRFFYSAKTSRADRGEGNDHPTVKPTDLMAWVCRLVTPPGGTVLDPFMGSGSTGKAAIREGFNFIGTEQDPRFSYIARKRLLAAGAEVSSPLATKMAELDAALAELQAAMEAA